MFEQFISHLACPLCEADLNSDNLDLFSKDGFLYCLICAICVPVLDGFPLFTKIIKNNINIDELAAIKNDFFISNEDYSQFFAGKLSRYTLDPYVAFHPFNESTRTFGSLVPTLKRFLKKNDVIVDCNNWNGFTGEWLAGTFPDQIIISFWHNHTGPLGYKGFNYWQKLTERPRNLFIIFTSRNSSWPLHKQSVKVIHGYDILHHNHLNTIENSFRIIDSTGVIVFPHVHLNNSTPEPYFERGGQYLHGSYYSNWLIKYFSLKNMHVAIHGEAKLFEQHLATSQINWLSEPDTDDYNGFIMIYCEQFKLLLDQYKSNLSIKKYKQPYIALTNEQSRYLINPLIIVNPLTMHAQIDKQALKGHGCYLLERHPVYHRRLKKILPFRLKDNHLNLLLSLEAHSYLTNLSRKHSDIKELIDREIILPYPLDDKITTFWMFHVNSIIQSNFYTCWIDWVNQDKNAVCASMLGELITRDEANQIVTAFFIYFHDFFHQEAVISVEINEKSALMCWILVGLYLSNKKVIFKKQDSNITEFGDVIQLRSGSLCSTLSIEEILIHFTQIQNEELNVLEKINSPKSKDTTHWFNHIGVDSRGYLYAKLH
ncbi:MAG: hypothetical protein A3E88_07050 [Legionellales bacterium RIFCSPHIGHO2_12_FULL_35_11]|nr:MAG: hypothetical protein A3E88_07050 [Legionellales bacterium RIFCSPHIGHO2_12_FULL_35_11]